MTSTKGLVVLAFLFFTGLNAQEAKDNKNIARKIYQCNEVEGAVPEIDGILTDTAWNAVEWGSDFIQRQPEENAAPSVKTSFKIVYDKKNLFVAFRCYDPEPDKIVKRLSRRDNFDGDWVEINIDSYFDKRTAFSFTVNALGVKGDEFVSLNGKNWDPSWNPIWYVKTQIDSEGWTAEMRIPLSQLRFGKNENQIWGLQSTRRFFREEERSVWQRIPLDAPGWVSEFGELHGLKNILPQKQVEIQPYLLASAESFEAEEGNPFLTGRDSRISAGLDGKIGITNDLTLDFTVNPDFGQVEADPSAIALDGFQIFFREQRPFFIENKNIFDYNISNSEAGNTFGFDNVFYSRRIGRSPQGSPDLADNEFAEEKQNTTIIGAAKFSGKTKNGWSIGILETATAREFAEIDDGESRRNEEIEPLTNYFVSRIQKDFNDRNTFVGGIFTATNRNLPESLNFLHRSAYTGGFDIRHQWKDRSWYLAGNMVFSHVQGSAEAIKTTQESISHLFQRTDASHLELDSLRTSLTGSGGNLQLGKGGDGRFNFEGGVTWRSPELELNDMGFQRQADEIRHYYWMGYRFLKPFSVFRRLQINYNHWSTWDFEGNHNRLQWNINSNARFKNNSFASIGFIIKPKTFSNSALRGGPRFRWSDEVINWIEYSSDRRKKLNYGFQTVVSKASQDGFDFFEFEGRVTWQPLNALNLTMSPTFSRNLNQLQFVENTSFNNEPRYITGTIDQRTFSFSLRVNYTLNPNLSLQYWGQPFISRGTYSHFKHITNATAEKLTNQFTLFSPNQIELDAADEFYLVDEDLDGITDFSFEKPDFSVVQFRSNLVLRWEYIPGSEIFLVWSQDISRSGDPADKLLDGLRNNILDVQPKNIFLLKATYRFIL